MPDDAAPTLLFRSRHRLTHARQFQAVYDAKLRKTIGPIMVSTLPNTLPHPRLGLSVGVRVGSAVTRNRIKRLIREAFRLEQFTLAQSLTGSYDIVVGVRAGSRSSPLTLEACRQALVELVARSDKDWRRRAREQPRTPEPPASDKAQ
ncbi:MAG TPA: ribonuclease P protein component [Polyangiaceae bacterium]|nr:ribonuclease P protein component [Polyangiaceae bacterium]